MNLDGTGFLGKAREERGLHNGPQGLETLAPQIGKARAWWILSLSESSNRRSPLLSPGKMAVQLSHFRTQQTQSPCCPRNRTKKDATQILSSSIFLPSRLTLPEPGIDQSVVIPCDRIIHFVQVVLWNETVFYSPIKNTKSRYRVLSSQRNRDPVNQSISAISIASHRIASYPCQQGSEREALTLRSQLTRPTDLNR